MSGYFFITGMSRSGTTALDKILNMHEEITALSQPFPYLYRFIKKEFFKSINHPENYYVLNNLFKESHYKSNEFYAYLKNRDINKNELLEVFTSMKGFSGQKTQVDDIHMLLKKYNTQNFFGAVRYLLNEISTSDSSELIGSKEINCEEFVEPLLKNEFKCILIYRDPRDVITSLNTGKGVEYGGNIRPLLFHIRNWRKSVDIAISLQDQKKDFLMLKYEDLIAKPIPCLNKICELLGLSKYNDALLNNPIRDQSGKIWGGNSSENSKKTMLDPQNKGKYKNALNAATVAYIEKTCYPELCYLQYEFVNSYAELNSFDLSAYEEQFKVSVEDLSSNYSVLIENIEDENLRFETYFELRDKLKEKSGEFSRAYFVKENVFERLISASINSSR